MTLKLRALQITVITAEKRFRTLMRFGDGLVVLRAPNTSGKSTCFQAIVFALGLEGMYGPGAQIPLTPAVLEYIHDDESDQELRVLESSVVLEIENGSAAILTMQRWPKHQSIDRRVIRTWTGAALTEPAGSYAQRDYFVRLQGAAQHELGFHARLTEFLGWELPSVVRSDGSLSLLYLECIFPLFIVEQKRGWSGLLAQMPYYLRIPDMGKRAIEFVLRLDAYAAALKRRTVEAETVRVRDEWVRLTEAVDTKAADFGGGLHGVPRVPTADWPPAVEAGVRVPDSDVLVPLSQVIGTLRRQLADLETAETPSTGAVTDRLTDRLREAEEQLTSVTAATARALQEVTMSEDQVASLVARREALSQDLERYDDMRRLREMGAAVDAGLVGTECPTCHQPLPDALLTRDELPSPMSLDQNITFIREQVRTFDLLGDDLRRDLDARQRRMAALRQEATSLRAEIRGLRRTLVADNEQPAVAVIERRVRLADRLEGLVRLDEAATELMNSLASLAVDWRRLDIDRARIRGEQLSDSDLRKLSMLQGVLQGQLARYGFRSVPIGSVRISQLKYSPEYEGTELGPGLSASDLIRTIWAYLLGLLEVSRSAQTNHSGLLMFDEPRQQDADPVSFAELLRRAANCRQYGQQVLFATSESDANVRAALQGVAFSYLSYDDKILLPDG